MKNYFIDTNVWLRFFLKDNLKQYKEVVVLLEKAKKQKIRLIVIPETIIEIDYTLRKYYKCEKPEVLKYIERIINTSYIEIFQRKLFIEALFIYRSNTVSLVDAFLYCTAKSENASVFSFDKDFKKIK